MRWACWSTRRVVWPGSERVPAGSTTRRARRALIERDRNHPSVVIWGIHNENRAASAATSDALIPARAQSRSGRAWCRQLWRNDGHRSGFWLVRSHDVVDSWQTERQPMQDLHIYVGAPVPHGV